MAERRDTDTKMDGSTVQRLVNPTKDYRYVLIFVDMVFIGFTTTICQTIEIGRISKDLKGFERISTASFVVWIDFSAHNYRQTLQDLRLGFPKRPYF